MLLSSQCGQISEYKGASLVSYMEALYCKTFKMGYIILVVPLSLTKEKTKTKPLLLPFFYQNFQHLALRL